jgi:hypothetical protein
VPNDDDDNDDDEWIMLLLHVTVCEARLWGARDVFSRTERALSYYVNVTNIYHSHGVFPFCKPDNNYTLPPYQFKF